jgi:hypothetical protein
MVEPNTWMESIIICMVGLGMHETAYEIGGENKTHGAELSD